MTIFEKIAIIDRLVIAIKTFREQTGYNGDMFESKALNHHLKITLSTVDFQFWTSLLLAELAKQDFN